MDRSVAWDATLRIVSGVAVAAVGAALGAFLVETQGYPGVALALFVVGPTFVFGTYSGLVGLGTVVEAGVAGALRESNETGAEGP